MKFVQLAKNLKEEGLQPAYLIEGADAYFRDHAVSSLRSACGLTQPALNDVRYEGEGMKGKLPSLAAELRTAPFFDQKRIVRLYEFYPTETEWTRYLDPYLKDPCPTTLLLIVNEGKKSYAKKGIAYVDCGKESEETLSRWLFGMAKRRGIAIDGDVASLMVRYCAYDAARMDLELKKLALLLGEGGRVTRAVLDEEVAKDVEYKTYELTQAASGKNFSAFSEILHDLMEKGFDENDALSALVYHYRSLTEIADMGAMSDADIGKKVGLHPYAVKKSREAVRRMGRARAEELYLKLYRLSADMRSGKYSKAGALKAAVAEIFFGEGKI